MPRGRDIIFVSMEDWDQVWRRNQFVCAQLARRWPGSKILFVGLPVDVSNRLRRRDFKGLGGPGMRGMGTVEGISNIVLTKPLKLLPNTLAAGRRFNEALARRHVRARAEKLGLRDPVLWLNPHYAVHMAGRMGESAVVYDITDDWTAMEQSERVRGLVQRQDAELCAKADAVIVCSQRLHEMKRDRAANLHLVPNGVDATHYAKVCEPPDEGERPWRGPVLGYTGTVHPDRVDVELVALLAERFREGTVVLIGPDFLSAADRERLARAGVQLMGPKAYTELPGLMRGFDVCITPHRMTAFTESLNPIKLWEYLAAGKPIVSTDVAGFRDYPELARVARTGEEFVAQVRAAMAEGNAKAEARRAEARKHSWASRVDQIEKVIEGAIERRGGPGRGAGRRASGGAGSAEGGAGGAGAEAETAHAG